MMKELVINKLTDPGFLARVGRGGGTSGGMDAKRGRAWCEYGYKNELSFDDYHNFWSRTGIGYGAVKVLVDKCWETNPIVKDQRFTSLAKDASLWHALRRADTYRLASNAWSALLLTIADEPYSEPVERSGATKPLTAITPIWSNRIKANIDTDGFITSYEVTLRANKTENVHPSRLVIIGCPNTDEPYLRAGYNHGVDIEKILGGSGESSLKNAARQLHIDYDAEAEMDDLVKITGAPENTVRAAINEVVREMNRGNDAAMTTQGATVQMLTTAVHDPTGNFNVACAAFAASVGLPVRSIIGNQTGERATTEDNKMVAARAQARRINDLTRDVQRLCRALYDAGCLGTIVEPEWDDLTAETLTERIDAFTALVTAFAQSTLLTPEQLALAHKLTGLDDGQA